jgi:hypothetical protein
MVSVYDASWRRLAPRTPPSTNAASVKLRPTPTAPSQTERGPTRAAHAPQVVVDRARRHPKVVHDRRRQRGRRVEQGAVGDDDADLGGRGGAGRGELSRQVEGEKARIVAPESSSAAFTHTCTRARAHVNGGAHLFRAHSRLVQQVGHCREAADLELLARVEHVVVGRLGVEPRRHVGVVAEAGPGGGGCVVDVGSCSACGVCVVVVVVVVVGSMRARRAAATAAQGGRGASAAAPRPRGPGADLPPPARRDKFPPKAPAPQSSHT